MPAPNQPVGRPGQQPPRQQAAAAQGNALPAVKYFDQEGKLRPELLDQEAMQVGEALAKAELERAQLRRFYSDVLALKRYFELRSAGLDMHRRDEAFSEIYAQFRMLKARAYYACQRKVIPGVMKEFIQNHVGAVRTWKDFLAFCRHFEAVVAFHYAFSKK